jgi:hypothetical protein
MAEPVEDFASFVKNSQTQNALEQASFDQDADEKKAAHSIRIAKVFNTHPEAVYNDYDHFVQSEKSNLLGELLDRNASLRDYVLSDPMASKVSKDDWHNLDNFSRALSPLTEPYEEELIPPGLSPAQWKRIGSGFIDGFKQVWQEAKEGYGVLLGNPKEGVPLEPYGKFTVQGDRPWEKQIQAAKDYQKRLQEPSWDERVLSFVMSSGNLLFSPITVPLGAATGPLSESLQELTGAPAEDIESAINLGLLAFGVRHAMKEYGAIAPKGIIREKLPEKLDKALFGAERLIDRQERFSRAGEDLKPGLDRTSDSLLSVDAHNSIKILEEAVDAGEKTKTKELSPEQLAKFADIVAKNQKVGISYDAAAELYGDKTPAPGDGILGDIEGVPEQFVENANDGRDITVSAGQFTKMAPEIMKKLRESIRVGNGISIDEAIKLSDPDYLARIEAGVRPPIEGWKPAAVAERNARTREDIEDSSGLRPIRGPARKEVIEEAVAGAKPDEVPEIFGPGIISKITQARINRAIKRFQKAKIDAVEKEEVRESKRQMGKDWKEKAAKEEVSVREDFKDNPIYRFMRFMNVGEIGPGQKLGYKPKLDPDYVWPNHREQMPKEWFRKDGLKPDELANLFLYEDGHSLMSDLADYHRDKGDLTNQQYLNKRVKAEVERRMHLKYGEPDDQALERIRGEALGAATVDVVDQEVFRFHEAAAKIDPSMRPPISRTNLAATAFEKVQGMKVTDTKLESLLRQAGRIFRDTEDAHWAGKAVEAYRLAQNWRMQVEIAKQAKEIQKQDRAFTRTYDRTKGAEPANIDGQHALVLQYIYRRLGLETQLTEGQIKEGLDAIGFKSVNEFLQAHDPSFTDANGNQQVGRFGQEEAEVEVKSTIPPHDKIDDPTHDFGKRKDWTGGQMQSYNRLVQGIDKAGRELNAVKIGNERFMTNLVIDLLDKQSERMSRKRPIDRMAGALDQVYFKAKTVLIGSLKWNFVAQRFDQFEKNGPFTRFVMRTFNNAAGDAELYTRNLRKEFYNAVRPYVGKGEGKVDLSATVPNDVFYHPNQRNYDRVTGKPSIPEGAKPDWPMTEEHLMGVILHWLDSGKNGARESMINGFLTKEDVVKEWLRKYSRKEHWDLADEIAKVYGRLYKDENATSMRMTGVAIPKVPLKDVWTPFVDSKGNAIERPGRYWSISYDKSVSDRSSFVNHPSPRLIDGEYGLHRERTSFAAPVRLDLDVLANQWKRRVDYIHFAEPLYNAGKIAKNPRFQQLIRTRLGDHYMDSFMNYLQDISGRRNIDARSSAQFKNLMTNAAMKWVKMEVLFTLTTEVKHGLSAGGLAIREAGPKFFLNAPADWFDTIKDQFASDGDRQRIDNKFMYEGDPSIEYEGSRELKNRVKSRFDKLAYGVPHALGKVGKIRSAREAWNQSGGAVFQAIDNFFSKGTFRTVFKDEVRQQMENGLSWKDAVPIASEAADEAVRRAHGSQLVSDRAEFFRQADPGMRNSLILMGFWDNVLNNLYLATALSKDVVTGRRSGTIMKDLGSITATYGSALIIPLMIENIMDPPCGEDEHWYEANCFGKMIFQGFAGFVPHGREISHALMHGGTPSGMLGSLPSAGLNELRKVMAGEKDLDEMDWGKVGRFGISTGSWISGFGGGNQAGKAWQLYWDEMHKDPRRPENFNEWKDLILKQKPPKD